MQLILLIVVFCLIDDFSAESGYDSTCTCDSTPSGVCTKYICETTVRETGAKCFPGRSHVRLHDGRIKQLSQVQIGDLVLVNEKSIYEPILAFIHSDQQLYFNYLAIDVYSSLSNTSSTLFVSSNHLIFDYDSGQARFAGKVYVGDQVQFIHNNQIIGGEIINIRLSEEQRYYATLTPSDTIVVDGVVASNYGSITNHRLAHRMMGLYRWWIKLMGTRTIPSKDIPWMLYAMLHVERMVCWCGLNILIDNQMYDGTFQLSSIS